MLCLSMLNGILCQSVSLYTLVSSHPSPLKHTEFILCCALVKVKLTKTTPQVSTKYHLMCR